MSGPLTFGLKERTFMQSKLGATRIGHIHLDTAQIVDFVISECAKVNHACVGIINK
jgi:hypothetical protein